MTPRSPSRDLSDRYTGKRGYFRTPHWIQRWKYYLAGVAFIFAFGWAAVDIFQPTSAAYGHTHGPLANPHAAFDDNCAACHAPHSPSEAFSANALNVRGRWHDFTCEKCHSGPPHHESGNAAAQAYHNRCSNCHHDHLGRQNSLVRLADKDCTHCHANLKEWYDPAKSKAHPPYENSVTNFVTEHPKFRSLSLESKPRTLKFSHAVHMNPGQAYTPGGKEAMTVDHLRELGGQTAVDRYAPPGAKGSDMIQLDCASCHKLDAGVGAANLDALKQTLDKFGEPTKSLLPPRQSGAYFLPVNFEAHCRSCHPLRAPEGTTSVEKKELVIPGFEVPHRKTDLLAELETGYLKGMIARDHPALKQPAQPGGKADSPPDTSARKLGEETERLAQAAQKQLFSGDAGCAKCHTTTGSGANLRVAPVPDRTVWFKHAKFNHAAHRGATCASCHPGTTAAPISPVEAAKPEPVQILGIESCRACHSPAGTTVKLPDGTTVTGGGIRHNCTDCHNYHHGDLPLQGRGSPTRFPNQPRDLVDWLKGK